MTAHTALFFRTYQLATVPLYAAMVEKLCDSSDLPFELSTVLEDIGQAFLRFADAVNAELTRRGVLDHEPEGDQLAESRIDRMMDQILSDLRTPRSQDGREAALLDDERLQQALRTALTMTCDLPIARRARPTGRF